MRMSSITAMLVVLAVGLLAGNASAQRGPWGPGGGGRGKGGQCGRLYDSKTVESVTGEVVSVERITSTNGIGAGVHLQLKTETETLSIHLGPARFIEKQSLTIEPKDKIEVRGSRVTFDGKPAIIAAEVKKSNDVLKLRDENGVPVWAGWRRR